MASPRTRWAVLVPVVTFLAGLLFATSGTTSQGRQLRSAATGIPDLIRSRTLANERATTELAALQADADRLTRDSAPGDAELARLKKAADALAVAAGRTPVRGPAVRVALQDSRLTADQLPDGFVLDDLVIHQQDVQAVVNALWAGGAEAMTIQDQRVISTSAVRCVGNTLILQGRVYSPPFVVTAIGDPSRLRESLDQSPAVQIFQQHVAAIGLGYEVSFLGETTFPAYEGTIAPQHAVSGR